MRVRPTAPLKRRPLASYRPLYGSLLGSTRPLRCSRGTHIVLPRNNDGTLRAACDHGCKFGAAASLGQRCRARAPRWRRIDGGADTSQACRHRVVCVMSVAQPLQPQQQQQQHLGRKAGRTLWWSCYVAVALALLAASLLSGRTGQGVIPWLADQRDKLGWSVSNPVSNQGDRLIRDGGFTASNAAISITSAAQLLAHDGSCQLKGTVDECCEFACNEALLCERQKISIINLKKAVTFYE